MSKRAIKLDDIETTLVHAELIKKKGALKKLYIDYYNSFKKGIQNLPQGKILEIGSGGGFIKEIIREAITSEVIELPGCDIIAEAEKLPFLENELKAILMINVLHHIKKPELFFTEAERVLTKGGKIIIIDHSNTWWSRFICKNLHHEPFNENGDWEIPDKGRLSGANGAMAWILFSRDKELFTKKFPTLEIVNTTIHTPFLYLLCGGVKNWTLIPGFLFGVVRFFENSLKRIGINQGMFQTIELRKV